MNPESKSPISYQPLKPNQKEEVYRPQRSDLRKAGWWTKSIPYLIFIPSIINVLLICLSLREYKDSNHLYTWTQKNRTSVQVIVHILSAALAFFWVYPICTIINHWGRNQLCHHVAFETLKLWSAMSTKRVDQNLPWILWLSAVAFMAITYLPATVWVGALTPVFTTKCMNSTLMVPSGGPSGEHLYLFDDGVKTDYEYDKCWILYSPLGKINTCPLKWDTGTILDIIPTASKQNRSHSKWDNSGYQYIGRSHGVGSAIGLNDSAIMEFDNLASYTFSETGFNTIAACIYNQSSDLRIIPGSKQPDDGVTPMFYFAFGALPNSNWTYISEHGSEKPVDPKPGSAKGRQYWPQASEGSARSTVSTFQAAPIDPTDNRYMFGIATGAIYDVFNNIQCDLHFEPYTLLVNVSIAEKQIMVRQDVCGNRPEDIDPAGNLRKRAMGSYHLSYVMLSLCQSPIGDSFLANAQLYNATHTVETAQDTILRSMELALKAIMDDTLVALGSAALFRDSAKEVTANVTISAVRIGSSWWIWCCFILNLVGLLGILAGCFLLREAEIPIFDFNDLGCMALGVINGVSTAPNNALALTDSNWDGSPDNKTISRLFLRLEASERNRKPAIIIT